MITAELMFRLNNGEEIELFGSDAKLFLSHIITYKQEGELTVNIDLVTGKMNFKTKSINIFTPNSKDHI